MILATLLSGFYCQSITHTATSQLSLNSQATNTVSRNVTGSVILASPVIFAPRNTLLPSQAKDDGSSHMSHQCILPFCIIMVLINVV
jgi:hypothetical protein